MSDRGTGTGPVTATGGRAGSERARVLVTEHVEETRPVTGVVVGVDGSRSALRAARWAAAEAARRGTELDLVQVLPPAGSSGSEVGLPHGRARALLYRAAGAALAVAPTVPVSMATVYGKVGPALVSYAAHAALLVTGSNGPGGPIPLSVGRVLAEVTAHAECPVVIVPTRRTDLSAPSDRSVFVAVEDVADDEPALDFAAETAHRWGVPLVVVTGGDGRERHGRTHGLTTGDAARYRERYPGLSLDTRVVTGGTEGPMWWAGRGAQLIVVSSLLRGSAGGALSGWTRRFLPVLSPCPVAVAGAGTRSTAQPSADPASGATSEAASRA